MVDTKMITEANAMLVKGEPLFRQTWAAAKESFGWSADSIDLLVPHQVSKKVHALGPKVMGVCPEKIVAVYPETGNVAAAGVFVALSKAQQQGRLQPGKRVALLATGSGINCIMAEVMW
jgi:3-oxoacyl-[acyl-carrier-protein] synthase-3